MRSSFYPMRQGRAAFTLLEIMLALTVFAIAVVGMVKGINLTIRSASMVEMESQVRQQLCSRVVEGRLGRVEEGKQTSPPDPWGVIYTTVMKPVRLKNRKGQELPSLYKIRVLASWEGPDGPQTESMEEYVFQTP